MTTPQKTRIGLLPLYLALYDEVLPDARDAFTGYLERIGAGLEARGIRVRQAPVCCVADEIAAAVRQFETGGIDAIVTLHLAYSPSLEAVDALCATSLPIVMLDTSMDAGFGTDTSPDRIMFNHGIHGVMDLASVLRRRGRSYEIVAGHYRDPTVLERAANAVRDASTADTTVAGRCGDAATVDTARPAPAGAPLRGNRMLRIGDAFTGMGDFAVDPRVLRERFGIMVEQVGLEALDRAVEAVTEAYVTAELAADRERFDCELEEAVHRQSVRVGLGLRQLIAAGGYHGFSINFQEFNGNNRPANTMPFLEISKAMARGTGYAGEGDVLTAALVAALAREFDAVTFTEIFCPDWSGNSLFLSHMGENSPSVAGDRPRICARPAFDGKSAATAVLTCAVKPGPAVFVNLAPSPADSFSLIVAPVEVLAENGDLHPAMRDNVRAWIRPRGEVSDFLEAYSRAGGTHHSALVLGDRAEAVVEFGRMLGAELCVLGQGSSVAGVAHGG